LPEIAKRWSMAVSDLEDYALDEMLQLSVFVVDLPAESGIWEGAQRVLHDLPILTGPQPLPRSSLLEVFRDGQAEVRAFRTEEPSTYLHIRTDVPGVVVRRDDLIVTREERDRFETEHAATSAPAAPPTAAENWHNDDFTRVLFGGAWHKFGKKQAAVLRLLKASREKGEPWCEAQQLLTEAKANSLRLVDLFRHKPVWRQLIEANGNGGYRMNVTMLSPEPGRVRLFRRSGAATRVRVFPRPVQASEHAAQARVQRERAMGSAAVWQRG
jgi:hypothetical protein